MGPTRRVTGGAMLKTITVVSLNRNRAQYTYLKEILNKRNWSEWYFQLMLLSMASATISLFYFKSSNLFDKIRKSSLQWIIYQKPLVETMFLLEFKQLNYKKKKKNEKHRFFNILRSKEGLILRLGQLIKYCIRKICWKCAPPRTSTRSIFNFGKLPKI